MLFFPFGIKPGEIVDPDKLSDEYVEASRIAGETGQFQWSKDAFPGHKNYVTQGNAVTVHEVNQPVDLQVSYTDKRYEPVLDRDASGKDSKYFYWNNANPSSRSDVGTPVDIGINGTNTGLFHIPYARGWREVEIARADASTNTASPMEVTWTSEYPELVWIIFSFNYVRNNASDFYVYHGGSSIGDDAVSLLLRSRVRLTIDGAHIDGSGPYGSNPDGLLRGNGYAGYAMLSSCVAMANVGAGTHRVVPVASCEPHADADSDNFFDGELKQSRIKYLKAPPVRGVCLGARRLIVLRFPKGMSVRG